MDAGLLGAQKFEQLKQDFDGTLGRLKGKVVELQNVGQGDRRNALSQEIGAELGDMDVMVAEMSKEVDLAKGRSKADWQADLRKCKKDKATLQAGFDRISLKAGAATGAAGGNEDARSRMLRMKAMQDSTNARSGRIRRNLDETEQTGAETLRTMEGQTDRYAGVVDKLKDAATNIDVAGDQPAATPPCLGSTVTANQPHAANYAAYGPEAAPRVGPAMRFGLVCDRWFVTGCRAGAANRRIYRGQFYTKIILYATVLVVFVGVLAFILYALGVPPFKK